MSKQIISGIVNPVEALVNLIYLIKLERSDPAKVLELARMADSQLRRLTEIVQENSIALLDSPAE